MNNHIPIEIRGIAPGSRLFMSLNGKPVINNVVQGDFKNWLHFSHAGQDLIFKVVNPQFITFVGVGIITAEGLCYVINLHKDPHAL